MRYLCITFVYWPRSCIMCLQVVSSSRATQLRHQSNAIDSFAYLPMRVMSQCSFDRMVNIDWIWFAHSCICVNTIYSTYVHIFYFMNPTSYNITNKICSLIPKRVIYKFNYLLLLLINSSLRIYADESNNFQYNIACAYWWHNIHIFLNCN